MSRCKFPAGTARLPRRTIRSAFIGRPSSDCLLVRRRKLGRCFRPQTRVFARASAHGNQTSVSRKTLPMHCSGCSIQFASGVGMIGSRKFTSDNFDCTPRCRFSSEFFSQSSSDGTVTSACIEYMMHRLGIMPQCLLGEPLRVATLQSPF